MTTFHPGDRVRIIGPADSLDLGAVVTVIGGPFPVNRISQELCWINLPIGHPLYAIDIPSELAPGLSSHRPPEFLEPYHGDDSREPLSESDIDPMLAGILERVGVRA